MYSHKFNGPGLAYELALSLYTNKLVWLNGPFKAGKGDTEIYESQLQAKIPNGKFAIVDNGLQGQGW
jgi:hypothetical protein